MIRRKLHRHMNSCIGLRDILLPNSFAFMISECLMLSGKNCLDSELPFELYTVSIIILVSFSRGQCACVYQLVALLLVQSPLQRASCKILLYNDALGREVKLICKLFVYVARVHAAEASLFDYRGMHSKWSLVRLCYFVTQHCTNRMVHLDPRFFKYNTYIIK